MREIVFGAFFGVVGVAILVVAFLFGSAISRQGVAHDCAKVGAFSYGERVYRCEQTK